MSTIDFRRIALSALGAVTLSAGCVLAAVGPARAAAPVPATPAAWGDAVSAKLASLTDSAAARLPNGRVATADVLVRFDADGAVTGTSLARSSGNSTTDIHALAIARTLAYPPMPAAMRGRPQAVTLNLTFGSEEDVAAYRARQAEASRLRFAGRHSTFRVAAK